MISQKIASLEARLARLERLSAPTKPKFMDWVLENILKFFPERRGYEIYDMGKNNIKIEGNNGFCQILVGNNSVQADFKNNETRRQESSVYSIPKKVDEWEDVLSEIQSDFDRYVN